MQLSSDQVLALAPDTASAAAGRKLANARHWKGLGQSAEAAWGECQGSALYQVRAELATLSVKCTCPSHKFPCKHGLGLLLLVAAGGSDVPVAEPPEWVATWLAKRAAASEAKHEKETGKPAAKAAVADGTGNGSAGPSAEQVKRQQKREALIAHGLDSLDLWLNDLVRTGLAAVETQPTAFWARQAAAMVDAQAPGIAARLRHIAEIPGSGRDWPDQLLGELGRVALLTYAYRRADTLEAALSEDVRQLVGWTLKEDEVAAHGDVVADDWLMLGQYVVEEDRGRTQRTWLLGRNTRRPALILQFSFAGTPFKETLLPGMCQPGALAFWPGAAPVRARFMSREGTALPISGALAAAATVEAFLEGVAATLARQPWQDRFLCALSGVTPVYAPDGDRWYLRDAEGAALRLAGSDHWKLLAISGGAPVDLAGEWDGDTVLPLGVVADGAYSRLHEEAV
jgi:hypothetical protein